MPGLYEHYKGGLYRVLGVGKHSETLEALVVYEPCYESETRLWVRPQALFLGTVLKEGKRVPRFKKLSE